jgi:hypothetical protein
MIHFGFFSFSAVSQSLARPVFVVLFCPRLHFLKPLLHVFWLLFILPKRCVDSTPHLLLSFVFTLTYHF